MSNCKILYDNFADSDAVNGYDYSSQNASFPVTNSFNEYRRNKVWRTSGYWLVVGGSNTLIFREQVGVDITATIAAGEYSSTTTFLAAIKTALEATGAATYTVSIDTSGKIKILSALDGGVAVFQLRTNDAGSLVIAAMLGFDTSVNLTGSASYVADVLKIHTSEWIRYDMGVSSNPKAFVLIGPRNEPLEFSPTATIKIQGNHTDMWTSPVFEQTVEINTYNLSYFNSDGFHTEELRYWRVQFDDKSNPNSYLEIGFIYLGDTFEATRGGIQFPLDVKYIDRSTTTFSDGGYEFTDQREKASEYSLNWEALTYQDKESIDFIFDKFGLSRPMLFVLDPNEVYSSDSHIYTLLLKFDNEPQWQLVSPNNFSVKMSLREVL